MKIIYFGHRERGVKCLQALLDVPEFKVVAVIGAAGETPSSVVDYAKTRKLPTYRPARVNDASFVKTLAVYDADILVMAGYGQILKEPVLKLAPKGVVNLHGGLLPDYRGSSPVNWSIINGETKGGCTVLFADKGIDTGDILAEHSYDIGENDTAADIYARQVAVFPDMLVGALKKIANNTTQPQKQDLNDGCYYSRRTPQDGKIYWREMTAKNVHNLARALVPPYPGAFAIYDGRKVVFDKTAHIHPPVKGPPGRVVLKRNGGFIVCCADKALLVTHAHYADDNSEFMPRLGWNME